MEVTEAEIRVLGSMIEKHHTTPDAYPLSVNALRLACNQATNREPVVEFDEPTVRAAAERLGRRGWARFTSGRGSRTAKYRHVLDDALGVSGEELAVLCVLMLRGPQTPGEVGARVERLRSFADLGAVEATLDRLADRELAVALPRRPGQREQRYAHRLRGDPTEEIEAAERSAAAATAGSADADPCDASLESRLAGLEDEVRDLRETVERLREELGA